MRQVGFGIAGGPSFTVTADGDQLLLRLGRAAWPDEEQPTLNGGLRAIHLAIPLRPRRDGADADKIWVHLKYPDGSHGHVASVDADDFARVWRLIEQRIFGLFLAASGRCEPEDFLDIGGRVMLPKPSLDRVFEDALSGLKRMNTYSVEALDRAAQKVLPSHMEEASPLVLHDSKWKSLSYPLTVVADEGVHFMVQYVPAWVDGQGEGWIASLSPFFTNAELEEILAECLPASFWEKFYLVTRELQAPIDRDKLERFMRKSVGKVDSHLP